LTASSVLSPNLRTQVSSSTSTMACGPRNNQAGPSRFLAHHVRAAGGPPSKPLAPPDDLFKECFLFVCGLPPLLVRYPPPFQDKSWPLRGGCHFWRNLAEANSEPILVSGDFFCCDARVTDSYVRTLRFFRNPGPRFAKGPAEYTTPKNRSRRFLVTGRIFLFKFLSDTLAFAARAFVDSGVSGISLEHF